MEGHPEEPSTDEETRRRHPGHGNVLLAHTRVLHYHIDIVSYGSCLLKGRRPSRVVARHTKRAVVR